jgi:hypothetical protein
MIHYEQARDALIQLRSPARDGRRA